MKKRPHPRQLEVHFQRKRREEYLSKQGDRRNTLLDVLRESRSHGPATAGRTSSTDGGNPTTTTDALSGKKSASEATRAFWASQFMIPEWMVDVPLDIGTHWFVMARPEGQRCLVVLSQGRVTIRNKSGAVVETLDADKVGWARMMPQRESILDCILQKKILYVVDVLCWGGHELFDCTAEFRMYWKLSTMAQVLQNAQPDVNAQYGIMLLKHHVADPTGILCAWGKEQVPFVRDGLIFLHKSSCYQGGQCPLMLTWKDSHTSRYCIDTDSSGVPLEEQHVILSYGGDSALQTGDEVPMTVASLPSSFEQANAHLLKPGQLFRCTLQPNGIHLTPGGDIWLSLEFHGTANRRRKRADTISKIIFQNMARQNPLTIDTILEISRQSSEHAMEDASDTGLQSIGTSRA